MSKYVMALDAGTKVTAAFYLIKKGKSAASRRENSHSIFQNQAG